MGRTRNFGAESVRFNQGIAVSGSADSNGGHSLVVTGSTVISGLSYPTADGTADYVLKTDGSGNLSWTSNSGGGGGGISFDGSTANGILSYKDADEASVESNLTFDGTDLTVAGAGSVYVDKIRRATDSGTTTKVLLNDESIKLYAGHSTDNICTIDSTGLTIDNGSLETATIDYTDGDLSMTIADGGKVTFAAGFDVGSDATGDILYHNGTSYVRLAKGTADQVLTMNDAATAPNWEDAAGGGSSSDTFIMFQQIEQTLNLSTSYYYYKNVTGGYGWTNNFSPTNFSTSFPYWRIHRYASSGTVPVNCTMTKYRIVGHKDGSDNDTITVKLWKVPAATHGDAETDIPTIVEVVSVEINTDANDIVNKNAAISSNNSFSAGDSWFVTINPTSAYMTSDHYLQLSVEFTVS